MLLAIIDIVSKILWLCGVLILVQVVLGWLIAFNVVNSYNHIVRTVLRALDRVTEPVYRPIRRILPDFGGIDFTPMVVLLVLWVLQRLLAGLAFDVYMSQFR
jgi:YggT family protein